MYAKEGLLLSKVVLTVAESSWNYQPSCHPRKVILVAQFSLAENYAEHLVQIYPVAPRTTQTDSLAPSLGSREVLAGMCVRPRSLSTQVSRPPSPRGLHYSSGYRSSLRPLFSCCWYFSEFPVDEER